MNCHLDRRERSIIKAEIDFSVALLVRNDRILLGVISTEGRNLLGT